MTVDDQVWREVPTLSGYRRERGSVVAVSHAGQRIKVLFGEEVVAYSWRPDHGWWMRSKRDGSSLLDLLHLG